MRILLLITEGSSVPAEISSALKDRYETDQINWVTLPKLQDALDDSLVEGPTHVILLPCVFKLSDSAQNSIQGQLESYQNRNPSIKFLHAPPLGSDPRLVDILEDRLDQALLEENWNAPIIRIDGLLDSPRAYSYGDLEALPNPIANVGEVISGRQGKGLWVRTLLENLSLKTEATHVLFHASDDGFSASVKIPVVLQNAVLVYSQEGLPLSSTKGGPLRLLIPEVDDLCANVKGVNRLEIVSE